MRTTFVYSSTANTTIVAAGIRNYVARNNLRAMRKGDLAFFYHSNCKEPGIVGTMEIVREHSPDRKTFSPPLVFPVAFLLPSFSSPCPPSRLTCTQCRPMTPKRPTMTQNQNQRTPSGA